MSNEIPKPGELPDGQEPPAEETGHREPSPEKSEDELQTEAESACREKFIQDHIFGSSLNSEQKLVARKFVEEQPGEWRHYNGDDFRVIESRVESNCLIVVFGMFFDAYQAQETEERIPL